MPLFTTELLRKRNSNSPWFVQGFDILEMTGTTITMGPGITRSIQSDFIIQTSSYVPNISPFLSVDITKQGLGGWFPIFIDYTAIFPGFLVPILIGVVGDSKGVNKPQAILFSQIDRLPDGYDSFSIVQLTFLTSSGIYPYLQTGSSANRVYSYGPFNVLTNGQATGITKIDLDDGGIPVGNMVKNVYFNYSFTPNASNDSALFYTRMSGVPASCSITKGIAAATPTKGNFMMGIQDSKGRIYYSLTSNLDSLNLDVTGMEVNLSLFLDYLLQ